MGLTTLLSNSQDRLYGAYSLINTTMDIRELENFKLDDAVKFHKELNPALWTEKHKLDPEVRKQLLIIADDFVTYLGLKNLDVEDVRISGSNAAYSYTPNSDLDLHIIVDMNKLSNDDVYKELFATKKTTYNDEHEIKVHGVPVELYVQDSNQVHHSLGEYSLVNDDWIRIPKKQRANFNQQATKLKYEKLGHLIELVLQSNSLDKVKSVIDILKRYRQAGLDAHGEFGPENLAYKALRKLGYVKKLYDYKNKLHSEKLSIEEQLDKPTITVDELMSQHGETKVLRQLELGIQTELEHTNDLQTALKIALAHLGEDPNYYNKLGKAGLEESASGYIPSNAEKDDPRFKTALTVDIKPDSLQKNANAFGFKVKRSGIPPTLSPNGKYRKIK